MPLSFSFGNCLNSIIFCPSLSEEHTFAFKRKNGSVLSEARRLTRNPSRTSDRFPEHGPSPVFQLQQEACAGEHKSPRLGNSAKGKRDEDFERHAARMNRLHETFVTWIGESHCHQETAYFSDFQGGEEEIESEIEMSEREKRGEEDKGKGKEK